MLDASRPVRLTRVAEPRLQSRCLLRYRGADASLDARTIGGELAGTLVRTVAADAIDARGVTYSCPAGVARYEMRTLGAIAAAGIRLGPDDALTWDTVPQAPGTCTLAAEAVELGTRTITDGGILALSIDAGTGARLVLDSTGTHYRGLLHNGTTSVSVTLSGATPALGERFRLAMHVDARVPSATTLQLFLAIGESAAVVAQTAVSSPIALPAAWATDARFRANRTSASSPRGDTWLRDAWCCPDLVPIGELRQWT
jgi:hypothetical protein